MRFSYIFCFLMLSISAFTQENNINKKAVHTNSWYKACYKIPADTALVWLKKNNINFKYLDRLNPIIVLPDSIPTDSAKLGTGQYIWVKSTYDKIEANWEQVSKLSATIFDNGLQTNLLLYDYEGQVLPDAQIMIADNPVKYSPEAKAYLLSTKKWKENKVYWIKIATLNDTLIYTTQKERNNRGYYQYNQKNRWKAFPVVRQIRGIALFFKRLFSGQQKKFHERNLRNKQKETGFVLFNKPLYKPGDTVKLKAWITDRKEKPVTSQQSLWINYNANGSQKNFELTKISAASPGSFPYSFALPDSFPNDTHYNLDFRGQKKYNHLNAGFKMEEYQLPDISKFDFNIDHHEELLAKDTLGLSFEANGTNGLPLLDASMDLVILAGNVNHFYEDSLFVADTLFQAKYPLQTDGKTQVKLAANIFPKADMELKITTTLKNSSNETTIKSEQVQLYQHLRKIRFTKQQKQLLINYNEDGETFAHTAFVSISGDMIKIDTVLQLPTNITLHPLANNCTVQVYDKLGKKIFYESHDLGKDNNKPIIESDGHGDSIGFVCNNPDHLLINYTLTKGKEIIWQQQDNTANFSWYKKVDAKHIYHLRVNYLFNGEAKNEDVRLAVYFKKITVKLEQQNVVQPGGKDTLHVKVTDYKQQPVPFANLTASGQNTQLKEHFHFPTLPITMNYKDKHNTTSNNFSLNEPSLKDADTITHFQHIFNQLGLDTMHFYSWLNTTKPLLLLRYSISDLFPEISVKAIAHGSPEAIFITYLNKEASTCAWQNAGQPFSTQVYPGYVQVGIRTRKKYIEIDSIYMQPYYKHELFINLDSIAILKNTRIIDMPDTLLQSEEAALEKRFISVAPNYGHNNVWLWQGSVAAQLYNDNKNLIIGPFNSYDSIHAYKANNYQFKFPFEPGFTYRLSKNLVRMEKTGLFQGQVFLQKTKVYWHIGDTIPNLELPPPTIIYPTPHRWSNLRTSYQPYSTNRDNGTMQLQNVSDSSFLYAVLIPSTNTKPFVIYPGNTMIFHNISIGQYKLVLVSKHYLTTSITDVTIRQNGLSCYEIHPKIFSSDCPELDSILLLQNQRWTVLPSTQKINEKKKIETEPIPLIVPYGKSNIAGNVFDKIGKAPITGASVVIKGTKKGSATDANGHFVLQNLAAGNYTLQVSAIGYLAKSMNITMVENQTIPLNIDLEVSNQNLDEVVVIGYGTERKMSLTGSVASITSNNFDQSLQGKVAGLSINDGQPGGNSNIRIRGIGSLENNKPLIIVDGVLMDEIPTGMDTSILKIEILKDATATSLYGARAANGVIIISTGRNNGPAIRTKFKDDAYWVPNAVTDRNGIASIPIKYPDNITNWQNIVYAAAKKGRYGRTFSITKAFKSVQGLLTVPAFLTVGDSVQLVGKTMNFSANTQTLSSNFIQGTNKLQSSTTLASNASNTQKLNIKAPEKPDTLKASFVVTDAKNNADGEERTIPVFERGTLETKGQFFVLDGDTTIQFKPSFDKLPVSFYAENRLIDMLEKELENLKNYPQACMEQTANKLWGLIMMRQIKAAEHLPFGYEKIVAELIDRLMKNQQLDGGWPWWPGGSSNLYITTKVLQALRQIAPTEIIRQSIRNGSIYLQNQLANNNIPNKLEDLAALAEGKHVYPYQLALDTIHFDSLNIHQQWQWVRIKQKAGLDYKPELEKLLRKEQSTITGGIFWGIENWRWYSNRNASTVLAFRVLEDDSLHQNLLPHIKQYFLEQKSNGYYRNTVEEAEISALLLTSALQKNNDTSATQLTIANNQLSQFPATGKIDFSKELTISKKGKGLVYLGLSQQFQNKNPQKVDSLFDVQSVFTLKNGDMLKGNSIKLPLALPINMLVNIVLKKEAQFVQIEIPIPAGMVYASKPQGFWEHREYLKDKVLIFKEQLPAGEYQFTIPLETRFGGRFALNPAKVELMYFPMFFGREGMKEVGIE